jgi:hypothetical protein
MSDIDNDDFRGWRFDGFSREAQLERRVQELEQVVARLEREVRRKSIHESDMRYKNLENSLGHTVGTIGGPAVLPESPHKAD